MTRKKLVDLERSADHPGQGEVRGTESLQVLSIEKALRVIYAFSTGQQSMGLTELAKATGLGVSGAQRFVHTWVTLGYLRRDDTGRRYRPTAKLLDFAAIYLRTDMLARVALPYMVHASEDCKESVSLCEAEGLDIIHIIRVVGMTLRPVSSLVGRRLPIFASSGGRIILAFSPDADIAGRIDQETYPALTPHTLTRRTDILAAIAEARREGFCIVNQEHELGEITVSAPVIGHDGHAVAAINIPVSSSRWSVANAREKLVPIALRTARAISQGQA